MKKTILFVSTLLLVAAFFITPAQAKVTIKIAAIAPRGSSPMIVLNEMKNKIKEETNNQVIFKIYPGGIQGDEKDVLTKIKLGQLHGGAFTSVGIGRIAPEVRVTDIPFLFRNYEEVYYVRGKLKDKMEKLLSDKGFVAIAWADIGFAHTFSKEPITKDNLKDLKVWVWGDDILSNTVWRSIGVTPISLSITDVLTSLSSQLIDTAPSTPFGAVAFRWYKKFNYITEIPSTNPSSAILVSKKVWEKISPENRKKINNITDWYQEKMIRSTRKANADCLKILRNSGVEVVPISKEGIAFVTEMQVKARKALVGKLYSQELLDETLGYLHEYRQKHPESDYQRIH